MSTETCFGLGAIRNLPTVLEGLSANRIFLTTGNESFNTSGAAVILEELLFPYDVYRFSTSSHSPTLSNIVTGFDRVAEFNPDIIVAVGGGSVIDTAKSIRIGAVQDDSFEDIAAGLGVIRRRGLPLIAIPTTAGSGSETTHFAVVFIDNRKFSVAHDFVRPEVALIDPQLTFSMSPLQTAISGMDAFSQAMESLWSVKSTNESRDLAAQALNLAYHNIEKAVRSPSSDARESMSRAAHLAGKAIDISKTTGPHALSYCLTTSLGIPHGQAVALTVGSFLDFNYTVTKSDLNDPRGIYHVKHVLEGIWDLLGVSSSIEARDAILDLMKRLGLETRLASYGVETLVDCAMIASEVNIQRLSNNPRRPTEQQLETMLYSLI